MFLGFSLPFHTVAGERAGQITAVWPDNMVTPMTTSPMAPTAAAMVATPAVAAAATTTTTTEGGAVLPVHANIVHGYDVEALVDAAMGLRPMPTAPMYLDSFGMPLTRLAPTTTNPFAVVPAITPLSTTTTTPSVVFQQQQQLSSMPMAIPQQQPSALDIANAALAAAYGTPASPPMAVAPPPPPPPMAAAVIPSRILVLSNMVTNDDLASDDDYTGLVDEVREECAKFGQLRNLSIPRQAGGPIQASAMGKIFLEYATAQDAMAASKELAGRKFGDHVVEVSNNCLLLLCIGQQLWICVVSTLYLDGHANLWRMSSHRILFLHHLRQASFRKLSMLLDDCSKADGWMTGGDVWHTWEGIVHVLDGKKD